MENKTSTPGLVPQQEAKIDITNELGVRHYRHILSSITSIVLSFSIAFFGGLFFVLSLISLLKGYNTITLSDYRTFMLILYIEVLVITLALLALGTIGGILSIKLRQKVTHEAPQAELIALAKQATKFSLIGFCLSLFLFFAGLTTYIAAKIIGEKILSDYSPTFVWVLIVLIVTAMSISLYFITRNNQKANELGKDYYLARPVENINKLEFAYIGLGSGLATIGIGLFNFVMIFVKGFINIFIGLYKIAIAIYKNVIKFFKNFFNTFKKGSFRTRISYLFMGAGHSFMKRPFKTIMYLAIQAFYIIYMVMPKGGIYYLSKFDNLGDSAGYMEQVCQRVGYTVENCPPGFLGEKFVPQDNSMLIVLFSVATILLTLAVAVLYWLSIKGVAKADEKYTAALKNYKEEVKAYEEKKAAFSESAEGLFGSAELDEAIPEFKNPLPTFVQEIKELLNGRFHLTTLSIPTISISVFTILPLVFMILLAFTNFNKDNGPPNTLFTWVGLQTFNQLFTSVGGSSFSTAFADILQWTFIWAFFATFSNYILGLILAMIINRKGIKLKKLWRTVFVITIAVPQFVTLLLMSQLLNKYGPINETLLKLGWITKYIEFLTKPINAKIAVILVNVWVGVPYTMLITSGILMNIPGDLYESAKIDGASSVTQFTKITLPYMLFVTGPYLITQFIGNINNFNVIFFLTGGGPSASLPGVQYGKTDILVTWLYTLTVGGAQQQYAIGSALGIFIFVISVFITLTLYSKTSAATQEGDFA